MKNPLGIPQDVIEKIKSMGVDEKQIMESIAETADFMKISSDTFKGEVDRKELLDLFRYAKDFVTQAYQINNMQKMVEDEKFGLGMLFGVILILDNAVMPAVTTGTTEDGMKAISQAAVSWIRLSSQRMLENPSKDFKSVGGFAFVSDTA